MKSGKIQLLAMLILVYSNSISQNKIQNLLPYVNPFIGTARMGHTYPGATVPFGMVQLSPDTDTLQYELDGKYNKDIYKYCAGYQYSDKTIVGFSHTHFSGTGHSDLGDILIMPSQGTLQLTPGTADHPENGFRSALNHANEFAEPNYYKVKLDDQQIIAELTTSARVGMHQYTFSEKNDTHIILDLMSGIYNYENKNVWTSIRVVNDSLITGYRQTNGWARNRTVYFVIAFSKPFKNYGAKNFAKKQVYRGFWGKFDQTKNFPEIAGTQIRAYFNFDVEANEKIKIKVALSSVSTEGALLNLQTEIPHWNFEKVKKDGQDLWNIELNKIQIEALHKEDLTNFYTSMYHTCLSPTIYNDVDGKYKGLDQNIHTSTNFTNYTTFSLWDTYRALHPLFNITQPKRNAEMVSSMLAHYQQSAEHMLPIWSHYANENWCMIGYHSVSVIADVIMKGNAKFDVNIALDACVNTARNRNYDGLGYYIDKGYVPEDKSGASVSKTLEYAYDDWCIAQIAKKINRKEIYEEFTARSENYKNVYDASIGYMRPRLNDGTFKKEFDVLSTNQAGYIEGNSWNYSLYVPHQPKSLIKMMGGENAFAQHLDSLFTMELPDKYFAETEDISRDGIIGNYVHGNEPSHHVAYLFNYANQPKKTQKNVRNIISKMYHTGADGLGGNDDCGQMSAWYIFSAMGFYPVAPGSTDYVMGSPLVKSATINLENGNTFSIEVKNQSDKNVYVKKMMLNGKPLEGFILKHEEIMKGGVLVFYMGN
jgi:predicted alpha-1,2-mannosidase